MSRKILKRDRVVPGVHPACAGAVLLDSEIDVLRYAMQMRSRSMLARMAHHSDHHVDRLRARGTVRSVALLEPYEESVAYLEGQPADAPVVPEPSDEQRYLEGLVIGTLRYLHDPERPNRRTENLVPLRIEAGADHFTLAVRGQHLAAALHRLLPTWDPGADEVGSGIPGLRYGGSRPGTGVTFHLLGQPGRFTVEGISVDAFEHYRCEALRHLGLVSVSADDPLTPEEVASHMRPVESTRAASIIGRRLGLLIQAGVTAIDSWWNADEMFAVELSMSSDAPDPMPRILSQMQSPYLAPRLHLDRLGSDHHYLSIEGSTAQIDLRVLRVPVS